MQNKNQNFSKIKETFQNILHVLKITKSSSAFSLNSSSGTSSADFDSHDIGRCELWAWVIGTRMI
jgi:hypothetical protein